MDVDLLSLDAAGLLAAASEAERVARLAEVQKLEVLAAWAAVHSSDPTEGPEGRAARRMGNVLRQLGGEGTPGVQDFCLGEIALARGAGVTATQQRAGRRARPAAPAASDVGGVQARGVRDLGGPPGREAVASPRPSTRSAWSTARSRA